MNEYTQMSDAKKYIPDFSMLETPQKIEMVTVSLCKLLQEKNRNYGDSALKPLNIFSKQEPGESIKVRLDDKLNRIINSAGDLRKNDIVDMLGYLVLYCISQGWLDFQDLID
jgi:hypothetical protein